MSGSVRRAGRLAEAVPADHLWDVYAVLRSVDFRQTKDGRPYAIVRLADVETTREGRVWDDAKRALKQLEGLADAGETPVKVRCQGDSYKGVPQLVVKQIRAVEDGDPDYDPDQLVDPALADVEDLVCRTLVMDIETVPAHDRRELPTTVAEALARHAEHRDMEPAAVMGLSPFFGKVVSIALGDGDLPPDDQQVVVLAVPPEGSDPELPDWIRPMTEAGMLAAFWALAGRADVVVTYNGRGFDIPFLATRSLIQGVPARVDLLSQRFSLRPHLDLFDVLGQRGRGPSNLDVVCWALGIESPKGKMDGSMVAPAYARGEIEEIATYNAHDVRATIEVYQRVRDGLLSHRSDW